MRFDQAHRRNGEYVDADLSGARFRNVNFEDAKVIIHSVSPRRSSPIQPNWELTPQPIRRQTR
jgi:hypothetical protein